MIHVTCPHCQTSFGAREEHAGRRAKCPKCQGLLQVPETPTIRVARGATPASVGRLEGRAPSPAPATNPATPTDSSQAILAAFQGTLEPVRVSLRYRLGIVLVAVVMVVLPLVYVALIGLACWGLYLHAVHDTFWLHVGRGRIAGMAVLAYLVPIAAGALLLVFLIKPLFARPARMPSRRSLSPQAEPLLFAFVERICAVVGTPMPKRIDVDCEVNASASFRHGWWSLLRGNDLVLTIGLPLVAGLNLRQFAGVLAHEFGHFSQGVGMRLTCVIRSISFWFTRVVYERDVWDQRLVEWSGDGENRLRFVFSLARLFVWITRRILWVLMMVGHAVGGFMLRQMEFDADRYEARLVGSDTFESTCRRLLILNVATQGAHADLGRFFREGRLGDNLPKLTVHKADQIPADVVANLHTIIDQSTTRLFDTHPADKERIASAHRENAPGIFGVDQPASVLFADFAGLSINVTLDFYRAIFGPQFKAIQVVPTERLLVHQGRQQESNRALRRYFQDQFGFLRPLHLPNTWISAPADPRATVARLKASRQTMLDRLQEYTAAFAEYDDADDVVLEATRAESLIRVGLPVPDNGFDIPMHDCIATRRARDAALGRQYQAEPQLTDFERAAGERLLAAMELLHVPQVAARLKDATRWQDEVKKILPALAVLIRHSPTIVELREAHIGLAALAGELETQAKNEGLIFSLVKRMGEVYRMMLEVHNDCGAVAYPFDHAKGSISLGDYLLKSLPVENDLGGIYEASEELLATVYDLYARLVGRLTEIAEKVEKLVGLEPFPDPTDRSTMAEETK